MKNLPKVIESLVNQYIKPSKIFIHIPKKYRRFPNADVQLPDLSEYPNVVINRCAVDYGSATKFLPMLLIPEIEPDDKIIIVDDDYNYDPTLSRKLIDLSERYPNCATCMFGVTHACYFKDRSWNILSNSQQKEPVGIRMSKEGYIDVFEGFHGVCLKKRFFTSEVFFFPIPEIFSHDDIWLSAHVLKNGFHIVVSEDTVCNPAIQDTVDALSLDSETLVKSANLISFLQDHYGIYLF